MKSLRTIIIIFALTVSYGLYSLFNEDSHSFKSNEQQDIGSEKQIADLQEAYTGSWKGVDQNISASALEQNAPSPGQIKVDDSKKIMNENKKNKDKAKAKKKKKVTKKTTKKFNRYVGKNTNNYNNNQASFAGLNALASAPFFNTEKKEAPKSIDDWLASIANPPSRENLNNLILSYQSGLIKFEIFYGVIDKLLIFENEKVKQLGVVGLSAFPSGASFERLVQFIEKEPSESESSQGAKDYLMNYKKLENLYVLNQQLFSPSAQIQLQAALLIKDSAVENFSNKTPEPTDGPIQPQAVLLNRQIQIFTQSLNTLQTLSGSQNSQAIQDAIDTLQRLLKV